MKTKLFLTLTALLGTLACAPLARADFDSGMINVDLNSGASPTQSGAGVIGAGGDVWNGVTIPVDATGSTGTLLLATGGASNGVTLDFAGLFGFDGGAGNAFAATPYDALMRDVIGIGSSPATLTLSGLTPDALYEIYVYAAFQSTTLVSINSDGKTAAYTGGSAMIENDSYVYFASEAADASGQIAIVGEVPTDSATAGGINGFQIRAIPEPSSSALVVGAFGSLLARRRRRAGVL